MISATLYQEGGRLTGCKVKGHSGWADSGGDIVCAAVSTLTCTCVNSLESICHIIPRITEEDEKSGTLAFELPGGTEAEDEKAQVLMAALRQGLGDLADAYPDYVRLNIQKISH